MKNKVVKPTKLEENSKMFAFLGYALTIVGYLIVYLSKKEDKYAIYYARQGAALFILSAFVYIAKFVSGILPFSIVITSLLNLFILALWVVGIFYSLSGEMKEIPVVWEIAKIFFKQ